MLHLNTSIEEETSSSPQLETEPKTSSIRKAKVIEHIFPSIYDYNYLKYKFGQNALDDLTHGVLTLNEDSNYGYFDVSAVIRMITIPADPRLERDTINSYRGVRNELSNNDQFRTEVCDLYLKCQDILNEK